MRVGCGYYYVDVWRLRDSTFLSNFISFDLFKIRLNYLNLLFYMLLNKQETVALLGRWMRLNRLRAGEAIQPDLQFYLT